jgi:hypothetical protein
MDVFRSLFKLDGGLRILDVGGRPEIWESVSDSLDITFLNLPGQNGADVPTHHRAKFVEGDGCHMPQFESQSFDVVFSNSVIEHVGPLERQRAFASEVKRLGRSYWVQTPSQWFPIEAHTGMPFWWFYPQEAREFFLKRWYEILPGWTDSMASTRVLTLDTLRQLFEGASIWVERVAGISKSYAMYKARL